MIAGSTTKALCVFITNHSLSHPSQTPLHLATGLKFLRITRYASHLSRRSFFHPKAGVPPILSLITKDELAGVCRLHIGDSSPQMRVNNTLKDLFPARRAGVQ